MYHARTNSIPYSFDFEPKGISMPKLVGLCLIVLSYISLVACSSQMHGHAGTPPVTVFEGARLITGDGTAPIENSAFIVEGNLFSRVGRRGQIQIPAGARHVDLTGKTV